jgi:anaerobic selenocysteine-containing dehydrogenase
MSQIMKRSVCPYDCPDACGLLLTVENDRVVSVQGDAGHPYTRGRLCGKMHFYPKVIHSPQRLTHPLLRTGKKGCGEFRPITWDQAIIAITSKWKQLIVQAGSEAILPYSYAGTMGLLQTNAGHAFFHKLGASQLARTICSPAKGAGWEALMGNTHGMRPEEVAQSDYVIVWGSNTVATNFHFIPDLKMAQGRGAKVVLIEAYRTPTAALADQTILIKPGTDGALALGIMHILVHEGLIDENFIEKYVLGFDLFSKQVLPEYTPSKVSEITGVSIAVIEQLAVEYGKAKASYIQVGSGMSRYGNGAMTIRLISALPAITGAWQHLGGGCFNGTSMKRAFKLSEITREDFLDQPTRTLNMNQLGKVLCEVQPPVYSLYVYNTNPVVVNPDQNRVIQGLLREDLFTVVHERFMTDTARYADIILPATTAAEHSDFYRGYGHNYLQRAFPAIAPIGQSKSNWEVFQLLAQAMGFNEAFFQQSADDLIEHVLQFTNPLCAGIDDNQWKSGKAFSATLEADSKMHFLTPSGKIEFYNERLDEKMPRYIEPYGGCESLHLIVAPSVHTLNSTFTEQKKLSHRRGEMTLLMSPYDAKQRHLVTGQAVIAHNSQGEVEFSLKVTEGVLAGTVVVEGVWSLEQTPAFRSVNALLSDRLTDLGQGSTLSDNCIEVRGKNHD